ncbi:flagellar export protein FliJ [Ferrovum sp.]|uniref:flagellar export protein FliJ n=1 Tax=Ferrovum sp. TaxID=2609467 RepID=UPI00261E080B|nr:flagellar export protein FliJ [Ferrovum sp.]
MTRPFPLETLKTLSRTRSDQASRKLGQVNRRHHEEQKKLDMLIRFRADYEGRYQAVMRAGGAFETLMNFQHFLERLDEAVRQQRAVVAQVGGEVSQGQVVVQEAHRQVRSMEVLSERHCAREQERTNRSEQKALDEQVGQRIAHLLSEAK